MPATRSGTWSLERERDPEEVRIRGECGRQSQKESGAGKPRRLEQYWRNPKLTRNPGRRPAEKDRKIPKSTGDLLGNRSEPREELHGAHCKGKGEWEPDRARKLVEASLG